MLTELRGKGGQLCRLAKEGRIRCPLIIRSSSEDALSSNLFGTLQAINARWWLPDFLNTALGTTRFRQQVYRRLTINLWENQPAYPKEMLPWGEGSTQVDVTINFENPPTTIFVEVKYQAELAKTTAAAGFGQQYPTDQLIRNIRVGLWRTGWFSKSKLFTVTPRNFAVIVLAPTKRNPLVRAYRNKEQLLGSIPHSDRLSGLPTGPFIGECTFADVTRVLRTNQRYMTWAERVLAGQVCEYLTFKMRRTKGDRPTRQLGLLGETGESENSFRS